MTTETCSECGFEAEEVALVDGKDCMNCLLEREPKRARDMITMEVENSDVADEEYDLYVVHGTFGHYIVQFDVETEPVETQVAVDAFKTIGHYERLKGSGEVELARPPHGDTGVTTKAHRESINEERRYEAPHDRR